ncbi:expressed unknown protein [Seminavis robusta]|uniref:G-protein coupled receptors family 1 profile domain-containing protein n=1 Tax=Seminavis robusta TaxID=568900 RepID=A0A9N8HJU0_9STRA|nr:expressed unknown protein [Seminavis robusta]|eukprot:Sro710_g191110.1 n/a (455) ;mRNA; r:32465-33902
MRQGLLSSGCWVILLVAASGEEAHEMTSNNSSLAEDDYHQVDDYYEDDDYYDLDFTPRQANIMAYLPKPFSLLSLMCSYVIIREILCEKKIRGRVGGTPLNRMLMAMAIGDIIFSLAYFIGVWAAPQEAAYGLEGQGSVGSCTFQGFLVQLGLMLSVLSSTSLSFFYLLLVGRNWRDSDLEAWEFPIHGVIWLIALGLAIYPLPLQLYNSAGEVCWIESVPPSCSGDDCMRGPDPWFHQVIGLVLPFVCLLLSLLNLGFILCKVRQVENTTRRYAGSVTASATSASASDGRVSAVSDSALRSSSVNRKKSNAVAKQAAFYTFAFLLTYLPDLIIAVKYNVGGLVRIGAEYFAYCVVLPSAGTFNFLVFSRMRRMKTPEGRVLRSAFFCLCCRAPMDSMTSVFGRTQATCTDVPEVSTLQREDANKTTVDQDHEKGNHVRTDMENDESNDEFACE